MFVNTCSEKWMVAERTARELALLARRRRTLRFFDAGMGDGTVLSRVMRAMHAQFPRLPFYVAGKEISLEDVRLTSTRCPIGFSNIPNRCWRSPIFPIPKRLGSSCRSLRRAHGWFGDSAPEG